MDAAWAKKRKDEGREERVGGSEEGGLQERGREREGGRGGIK